MTVEWEHRYADRVGSMFGSMTRQLMHLMADPEIISFGGGIPASELLPVGPVKEVTNRILETDGPGALQYGPSEGYLPLRKYLAEKYAEEGFQINEGNVLITSGSQQGIDLVGRLLIDKGDAIVLGDPTFLTALQTFSTFRARYITVPLDEDGMRVELLPDILSKNEVKLIYVMPNFQNPTGVTLSLDRRKKLVEIANEYGVPILEDDPYGNLRYSGERLPPLKSMSTNGNVIFLGSLSKILSPGLRLSALIAPEGIMEKLVFAKQATDLHTNSLSQRIAYGFLRGGFLEPHLEVVIAAYRSRRDAMLRAMETHFPPSVTWTRPEGGIFVWVTLPVGMDAMELFSRAVAEKVAYVPGSCYFANGGGENTMRLNFSACDEEKIDLGIRRLAKVIAFPRELGL